MMLLIMTQTISQYFSDFKIKVFGKKFTTHKIFLSDFFCLRIHFLFFHGDQETQFRKTNKHSAKCNLSVTSRGNTVEANLNLKYPESRL